MSFSDGRVVSNFIYQALYNNDITIYGTGEQTRSFCYVDDLVDGLIKLFNQDSVYQPINLGNPEPISMNELAQEIIDLTNSKSKIVNLELPIDDPKDRKPDIEKAKNILNWKPLVSRKEGIQKTIEDFRKRLV
jgi:UDP-glucuronate decarboxylase